MNPRDPARPAWCIKAMAGAGFWPALRRTKRTAYVGKYNSVQDVDIFTLDLASGTMTPDRRIRRREIAYGSPEIAPDGTLWVTTRSGVGFSSVLGRLGPPLGCL